MAIFPYFMQRKCPYVGGWVVQKSLKTPLRNIKMAPNLKDKNLAQQCTMQSPEDLENTPFQS